MIAIDGRRGGLGLRFIRGFIVGLGGRIVLHEFRLFVRGRVVEDRIHLILQHRDARWLLGVKRPRTLGSQGLSADVDRFIWRRRCHRYGGFWRASSTKQGQGAANSEKFFLREVR